MQLNVIPSFHHNWYYIGAKNNLLC
jgi:hypothetical protein